MLLLTGSRMWRPLGPGVDYLEGPNSGGEEEIQSGSELIVKVSLSPQRLLLDYMECSHKSSSLFKAFRRKTGHTGKPTTVQMKHFLILLMFLIYTFSQNVF